MEKPQTSPAAGRVSLAAIVSTDVLAYIVASTLAVVVLCAAGIFLNSQITGEPVGESWTEVAVGISLIAAVLYGLLRWRAARVSKLLSSGRRARATLEDYFNFDLWVRVGFTYEDIGGPVHRKLTLVWGKRAKAIQARSEVTVVVDVDDPRRVTIADLYE